MIEVVRVGAGTTVQDLGRPGLATLGVPRSGAFDRAALRLANRLVGNDEGAAAIEVTYGGIALHVLDAATIACTGAPCPGEGGWLSPITHPSGAKVVLGAPATGLRSYVAVRGGFALAPVLGSRSTDRLSGLGPRPLRAGDRLAVGNPPAGEVASGPVAPPARPARLRVVLGPRDDWFVAPQALFDTAWTVAPESDRIGVRLLGPPLARRITAELPSEPTRPGALQVPPDGRPILLGPDAPVTGGYPVIGMVDATGLAAAAQLRPGDPVHFRRA